MHRAGSQHGGDFLNGALRLGHHRIVGQKAEDHRVILIDDAHVVGNAVVLAGLVRHGNPAAMQIEGHFAVQALVAQDGQHFRAGLGVEQGSAQQSLQQQPHVPGRDVVFNALAGKLRLKQLLRQLLRLHN